MNTIAARKELINEAMIKLEENKMLNWPWLTGFYASIIVELAADRPNDTEYVVQTIINAMEKNK